MHTEQPIGNYNGAPQKENGYTPIANELLEAIMLHGFSKRQLLFIMALCRMTYGYSKKIDSLSGWQISKLTNIDSSDISKTIAELEKMNVIKTHDSGRYSHGIFIKNIELNKYYDTWLTVGKLPTVGKSPPLVIQSITVGKSPTQPLVNHPPHKAIKTNKTIYVEILNYLNEKVGRNYEPVKANLDFIKARLDEGFSKDVLLKVIDVKASQWLKDETMNKYLRPATLFNASKFAQYAAEQIQQVRPKGVVI